MLGALGVTLPIALASGDGAPAGAPTTSSHGVWISSGSGASQSFFAALAPTSEYDTETASAIGASGDGLVAWVNTTTGKVETSFRVPGGAWSTPITLGSGSYLNGSWAQPAVAVDPAGDMVVVWVDRSGEVAYAYRAESDTNFVRAGSHVGGGGAAAQPTVALDSNGNAWVAWNSVAAENAPRTDAVLSAELSPAQLAAGQPGSLDPVISEKSRYPQGGPVIATNSDGGGVVLAWPDNDTHTIAVAYAKPGASSFGTPAWVGTTSHPAVPYALDALEYPSVSMDSAGEAALTYEDCAEGWWNGWSPIYNDCYAPYSDHGASFTTATAAQLGGATPQFNTPQTLPAADTSGVYEPTVALGDDGSFTFSW